MSIRTIRNKILKYISLKIHLNKAFITYVYIKNINFIIQYRNNDIYFHGTVIENY